MAEKQPININGPERSPVSEKKIQSILERLWLTYFNDTLYAQGVITEEERNTLNLHQH